MRKVIEIRNVTNDRVCDLVREEDDSLCFCMKYRDKRGKSKEVVITVSDLFYSAWKNMTDQERNIILKKLLPIH